MIGILLLVELALFNYPESLRGRTRYNLLSLYVKKNLTKRNVIKLNLYVLRPSRVVLVIVAVTAVNHDDDPIVLLTLLASRVWNKHSIFRDINWSLSSSE